MKIAVDGRVLGKSGLGEYLVNLLKKFIEDGYKLFVLVNPQQVGYLGTANSNLEYIILYSNIYNPLEIIEIAIKIPYCDLYWSPHFNNTFLPTKAKKRIVTVHDIFHLANQKYYSRLKILYLKYRYFQAMKSADLVISVSNFTKNEINRHFNSQFQNKIKVVYNGVRKLTKPKNITHKKTNSILFVGNIKPHKNLKCLINAFEIFQVQNPDFELILVGKIEGFSLSVEKNLLERIQNNSKIILAGKVSDESLQTIYSKSKILVVPSLYEGFGLPILEAYQMNVPTIVSDIEVFREVAGNGSIYFNSNNPMDLANKLRKLILNTNLRNSIVEKGKSRVLDFSWDKSYKEHKEQFLLLIN